MLAIKLPLTMNVLYFKSGPYKRAIYPTVDTEDNIFELMNDDISYTGYGKALFPPNPDAL
jgi:hypothetical protein